MRSKPEGNEAALQKAEQSYSRKFTNMIMKEYGAQVGKSELGPEQKKLAEHLFIGIDNALSNLEAKRIKDNVKKSPIVWANANLNKLAIDATHRVELGLDALIANHIHVVPYWNAKHKKYDLDLSIGYAGKDFYRRNMALNVPKDIIYSLVYANDTFMPVLKDLNNKIEGYEFSIDKPFDRGEVIGGFGYIIYDDDSLNKLVLVDMKAINKAKGLAKSTVFWKAHPEEMMYVVVVRRTTAKLAVDPRKVNKSFMQVELDDNETAIEANANGEFIDVIPEKAASSEPEQKQKQEQHPEQAPPESERPENIDDDGVIDEDELPVTCPAKFYKSQPRKKIKICKKCKHNGVCEEFARVFNADPEQEEPTAGDPEPTETSNAGTDQQGPRF